MASSTQLSSFFFFSIIINSSFLSLLHASSNPACPAKYCRPHGLPIRFPFRIANASSNESCSYAPAFDLTCNNQGSAILHLPYMGDFVADYINYEQQYVILKDPSDCLLSRLIQNSTITSSFFVAQDYQKVVLANCSADFPWAAVRRVDCLSEENYTVMLIAEDDVTAKYFLESCHTWTVSVPVMWPYTTDVTESMILTWRRPDRGFCEASGGNCALEGSTGSRARCIGNSVFSDSTKFLMLCAVMSPMLFCVIQLVYNHLTGVIMPRNRTHDSGDSNDNTNSSHSDTCIQGLILLTIESYPKTEVGDDGLVPRVDDDVCAICLSKYQPGETLRTIPRCAHYFHAKCIDRWLKRNASCPLCRGHEQ